MSEKKAKELRRAVYGDKSIRVKRRYVRDSKSGAIENHPQSLRSRYQKAKGAI